MQKTKPDQSKNNRVNNPIGYARFSHSDKPMDYPLPYGFILYEDFCSPDSKRDPQHYFLNADYYLNKFFKTVPNPWRIEGLIYLIEIAADYIKRIHKKNPDLIQSLGKNHNWLLLEERLKRLNEGIELLANICREEQERTFGKKNKSTPAGFYAKRAIATLLLNQHAFKYTKTENHPSWVKDCKSLPPFSKTTWRLWAKVVRKMIHEQMPDIFKQPEFQNHILRAKAALGGQKKQRKDYKLDGRMRGQIIDDIEKAIKGLATTPA